MADVIILFAAALMVLGGGIMVAVIVRAGRRRNAQIRRDAPHRLRADLRATDDYIARLKDTLDEDDLDSLNRRFRNGEH